MGHRPEIYDEENYFDNSKSTRQKLFDPLDPSFKDEHPQTPHSDKTPPNLTLNDGIRYEKVVSRKPY